ncbi:MAG: SH3 type 3 domain protein [Microgenomates group bacterium GW2011_GWC1_37_12b]|nr:MAG: SH3 type 3 domain protein [Microgenomates group bacterium GW2011_GWC1_37_12b]
MFGVLIFSWLNYPGETRLFKKGGLLKFNTNSETGKVKLLLGGDVMLGRTVQNVIKTGNDNTYPFFQIADFLKSYDLVFVNLENPIVKNCPSTSSGFKFCSNPESLESLKYGGIDIVNIANNHTGNYGKTGFVDTKNYLSDGGISYVGDGNLVIKQLNDEKLGFLGFDFTVNKPSPADYELVKKSDSEVDFLVVAIHWGSEYKKDPNEYQRQWAKEFIENGADIIAGSHPHWVQGVDCVNKDKWEYFDRELMDAKLASNPCEKIVFYSLGNLVFDQMWSEETKKGLLVELSLGEDGMSEIKTHKIYIEKIGQPIIVE